MVFSVHYFVDIFSCYLKFLQNCLLNVLVWLNIVSLDPIVSTFQQFVLLS